MPARATTALVSSILALAAACVPPRPTAQIPDPGGAAASSAVAGVPLPVAPPSRDDRLVIRRTADVLGVAVSRRFAFAATTGGLVTWDRLAGRWMPPLEDDGFALDTELGGQRPTAFAADPVEDAVWVGVPGAVLIVRPLARQLQRTTVVGIPDVITFARDDVQGALVRAGGQWQRVTRSGFVEPLRARIDPSGFVRAATIEDVFARFPALEGQLGLMLRDAADPAGALRRPFVTAGTLAPDRPGEAWIGTMGDGLWEVDANFLQAEPRQFGLAEDGVGALARGAGGVWSAGVGTANRGGVTYVSSDLRETRWLRGTLAVPLERRPARALALRGNALWLGTLAGLVRLRLDAPTEAMDWDVLHGLPDERVLAVAPVADGAWVGTMRGLARVIDTTGGRSRGVVLTTAVAGVPVSALALVGDTVWAGTDAGLFALVSGDTVARRPGAAVAALRRPVRALALADTVLYVVTDCAIVPLGVRRRASAAAAFGGAVVGTGWEAPAGCVPTLRDPTREGVTVGGDAAALAWTGGTVRDADVDERVLAVAADGQVLLIPRDGSPARVIDRSRYLPGRVTSVRLERDWLWIGTVAGLVRWRRGADGLLP